MGTRKQVYRLALEGLIFALVVLISFQLRPFVALLASAEAQEPEKAPDRKSPMNMIEELVRQLGAPEITIRELAYEQLRGMGPRVLEELRKHTFEDSPEGIRLARNLMADIEAGENPGLLRYAAVSGNGKQAFSGDSQGTIRIWDLSGRKLIRKIPNAAPDWETVPCFAFSEDGNLALSGRRKGDTLTLWNLVTGFKIGKFPTTEPVISVALSPDGKFGLSASIHKVLQPENGDRIRISLKTVRLWETSTGTLVRTLLEECPACFLPVGFSPDGKFAAAAGPGVSYSAERGVEGFDLKVWEVATGREKQVLAGMEHGNVSCFAFSPNGKYIVTGYHQKVRAWDLATGKSVWTYNKFNRWSPQSVAFSPNGKVVVTAGNETDFLTRLPNKDADGGFLLLDAASGKPQIKFGGVKDWTRSAGFSPDGKRVFAATGEGLKFWDLETVKICVALGN